jgi:hypothetical protein
MCLGGGVEAWPFSDDEAVKHVNARGEAETRRSAAGLCSNDKMKD